MRKIRKVKLSDKEVTVGEVRIKVINEMIQNVRNAFSAGADLSWSNMLQIGQEVFAKSVSGITLDELMDLYPSEAKVLYDAFLEVNADFLGILDGAGVMDLLKEFKQHIRENVSSLTKNLPSENQEVEKPVDSVKPRTEMTAEEIARHKEEAMKKVSPNLKKPSCVKLPA